MANKLASQGGVNSAQSHASKNSIQHFLFLLSLFLITFSILFIGSMIHEEVEKPSSSKDLNKFRQFGNTSIGNHVQVGSSDLNMTLMSTPVPVIIPLVETDCDHNASCSAWKKNLLSKLECIQNHCGLYFYYHMRKAAGTTITQYLSLNSLRLQTVKFFPAEGLPLDYRFLNQHSIITHISFRDPVDRIISLYWYEHVLYYHQVQKKPGKASSMRAWVEHWRDSSLWKQNYTRVNKATVYIEIENYYVKALSQWDGTRNATREDLEKAKSIVDQFDIVIISEMFDTNVRTALLDLSVIAVGYDPSKIMLKYLSTDTSVINMYQSQLASDEAEIRTMLRDMNQLDYELYEYAKGVMKRQMDALAPVVTAMIEENAKKGHVPKRTFHFMKEASRINEESKREKNRSNTFTRPLLDSFDDIRMCHHYPKCSPFITSEMYNVSGVVRPPLHKTPVNPTYVEPPSYPPATASTASPHHVPLPFNHWESHHATPAYMEEIRQRIRNAAHVHK